MTPEETHIQNAIDAADRVLSGREERDAFGRQMVAAVREATVNAPLHALAVSFLLGVILASRRR